MEKNETLVQTHQVETLLAPSAQGSARYSTFASLKNCVGRAHLIVEVNQAEATNVNINILQAINVAGGTNKAAPASSLWANTNTAATAGFVKQSDTANYLMNGATLTNKVLVFEIDPAALDTTNSFDCIGVLIGASNASNIGRAQILIPSAYQQTSVPSAITD